MALSNCIIYAIQRFRAEGGYLIIRKSRYGWWCHVLWSKDLRNFEEFNPVEAKRARWWPPILFHGRVNRGGPDDVVS